MANWKNGGVLLGYLQRRPRSELKAAGDDETCMDAPASYYRTVVGLAPPILPFVLHTGMKNKDGQYNGLASHRPTQHDNNLRGFVCNMKRRANCMHAFISLFV